MKIVHESIFSSALRSFFIAFFAVAGLTIALCLIGLGFYALYELAEKETFSSDVKILTDAHGRHKELSVSAPVLLQINMTGEIGKDPLTAQKIEKILLKSREDHLKDGRVKGILVVIDSPGGGVEDSDRIYRLLKEYKEEYQVPIFVYVDGMCASGGYYAACAADKIYASSTSVIGSIGVLAWPPFVNITEALQKIGINSLTLFAGEGKDQLNPLRPWKPGEQESYQKLINFYYEQFTKIVEASRPSISIEKLTQVYGAHIFPSPEAEQFGFIDGSNYSRSKVLKELALAAKIPEEEKYQVVSFETKGWLDKLIKEESFWKTGKVKHELLLPSSFKMEGESRFYYICP